MPRPSLDEIFTDTRPSLDEIFQERTPVDIGVETAKQTLFKAPIIAGVTPEQIIKGRELFGEGIERPVAGLRAIAKEGPTQIAEAKAPTTFGVLAEKLPAAISTFKRGLLKPEKYPIGTFAEALVDAGMETTSAGALGALADVGYYFGMPEALTRIATTGKVKLLEGVIGNVNKALRTAGEIRTGVVTIPKETLDVIAKNKDIGTVFNAYLKSKNLKLPRTTGLLEFKPTTPQPTPPLLLPTKPQVPEAIRPLLTAPKLIRPTLPEIFEGKPIPPEVVKTPIPKAPTEGGKVSLRDTLKISLGELRSQIDNVRYGKLGEIQFEFQGKTYTAPEPKDVLPVGQGEASKSWALRQILDKTAKLSTPKEGGGKVEDKTSQEYLQEELDKKRPISAGDKKRFENNIPLIENELRTDLDRHPSAIIANYGFTFYDDIAKLRRYAEETNHPLVVMAIDQDIEGLEKAIKQPKVKEIPAPKGKITILPRKEQLLTQIEEAIKKAPEETPIINHEEQKITFEIDGGANIYNNKKALQEFYDRIKKTPREMSLIFAKRGLPKAQGIETFEKAYQKALAEEPGTQKGRENVQIVKENLDQARIMLGKKPTAGFVLTRAFAPSEWITALDDVWYKSLGKPLEKGFFGLLDKITPEVVKRNIVEAYGQPISYQRLTDMLAADRAKNAETIKNISLKISRFKPEEVKNIRQYIESGNYPDTPLGQTAREIEDIFFDLGKQLVRYGLLKPGQFAKYADKYFPHYYRIFEKDGSITRWFRRRLDLSYAKHRTEPSEELKEAMGIIDDTPAPVAKKMLAEMTDVSLQRFFEALSQNPELSFKTPIGDFKQLPKNTKLGFLSEMYVHPSIADDLQGMVYVPQMADSIMTKMLSLWKTGKVVLNPPTVGRNIITNFFMADVIGRVPPENVAAWIQGAMSLKNKDKYYQLLRNQGKIGVEFYRGEIEDILNTFPSEKNPLNVMLTVLKKGGDYYSALEEWAKVTIFRKNVEDGMGIVEAAQLAEDAIFNYSKVAPLVRQLRQGRGQGPLGQAGTIFASPFITFKAKAIKGLSHAAFKRPFSLLKYVLLFGAIGAMAKKALDISDEKYKEMQSSMAERGRYGVLVPLKDEDNSYYMLDLTFMLPVVGDYLEMKSIAGKKGFLPAVQRATGIFGNPFVNIPAEILANKDFYSQREIYNELDLPFERFRKQIEFVYQQSVPPLAPFGGGYRLLEKQELPKKLLTLGGLRLLRYNEDEETDRQLRQLKSIDFQFNMERRRLLKDTRTNDTQKEKKMDLLFKGYERKKELLLK